MKNSKNLIKETLIDIPLETRFRILLEVFYLNLITDLGFREEKMWNEYDKDDMELLNKILDAARKNSKTFVEEVEEWMKDSQQ